MPWSSLRYKLQEKLPHLARRCQCCDVRIIVFLCCFFGLTQPSTHLGLFISNLEINSLASSEMTSKLSSSKSHSAAVTLAKVSLLSSPSNGDRPLSLRIKNQFKLYKHSRDVELVFFINEINMSYTRIGGRKTKN